MSEENKEKGFGFTDPTDSNPDPITGEPGAHPVGTGIGAAGAGAAGAAIGGVVGGPIGAVVGAAIGSVVGGLVGKGAAEAVNPTQEDEYWRSNHTSRSYVEKDRTYDDYAPAYKAGYEGFGRYGDSEKTFEEVEPDLKRDYEATHATAGTAMPWEKAREASRDAYMRLYEERIVANKTRQKAGEVAIGKHVETETAHVAVPVEKERVVIERVQPTETRVAADADFGTNQVARVEVYEEAADIQKEAFVREEVRVRKEVDRETVEAEETIRREELDIDTQGNPVVNRTIDGQTDRI
ncbi:YsnF/AvaK domain-containing protein [Microcoleus sp. FACHB-1515]|uniref:YsnF/AvaK domain-containing protein n=1 Tax=Cyanophyceae TaxID=3028117 RepID=UPI001688198A|nr:YsnF/AvaK domain-containing protein [Microcoleus sp. FACHB-1515]MBD2091079.1 YsnF/AvaK domain-containing protein [Microcoleus sp. FACHB-1515]